jgi:hypothetical protein
MSPDGRFGGENEIFAGRIVLKSLQQNTAFPLSVNEPVLVKFNGEPRPAARDDRQIAVVGSLRTRGTANGRREADRFRATSMAGECSSISH